MLYSAMPSTKHPSRATRLACCAPLSKLPDDESIDSASETLKALSHPVRLKILHVLAASEGDVCACDIEAHFDLTQPTISHHLRVLRQADLVEGEMRSPWVYYRLRHGRLHETRETLRALG
jgi:ArsR family transcriptional regulator, arsenate/arsenite/antimonite-responsive transcriptional repressor